MSKKDQIPGSFKTKRIAACDDHVVIALEWLIDENLEAKIAPSHIQVPNTSYICWCRKSATWYFKVVDNDQT